MNYAEIGQRIRRMRKAYGMSQEELAEKVDISTTHMSHIETGSTKLSLPVLVDIAVALRVKTDDLLFGQRKVNDETAADEIAVVMAHCTPQESRFITELVKSVKLSLDKYM